MKTLPLFKILILSTVILCNILLAKGQKIESIDSSEVYILSIFNYNSDSLISSSLPDDKVNNPNTLKVVILEKDNKIIPDFQSHLITGDNKYNFISTKDTFLLNYIDSIIQKYFIANTLF